MTLTREQVEDTALGILTRFGLADLSMRRLARELDVQVGALYWHVKNKQELLVGVAARLLRGVEADTPTLEGAGAREVIAHLARGIRTALVSVPDSAEVVRVAQSLQSEALTPLNRLRSLLEAAGIENAAWAQHLVMNHVLGSIAATQEAARLATVDPAAATNPLGDDAFEWGLRVILDGLFGKAAPAEGLAGGP
ncbi:TetR/AcrR family transcriptional regulator C-terminal domain-containing protein [Citricoccus sp. SGAir0253]|uniref:TetR/AcrR family transcriptional regulator C-terminal domain-containing protein n=1 Tax=Citricoccus sp. SGAir0253 TaxID=2567881 RepID=UPI00143CCEB7|nr:TetR family transcriptional regulator [Citricoccus sp. SGAir0253]